MLIAARIALQVTVNIGNEVRDSTKLMNSMVRALASLLMALLIAEHMLSRCTERFVRLCWRSAQVDVQAHEQDGATTRRTMVLLSVLGHLFSCEQAADIHPSRVQS